MIIPYCGTLTNLLSRLLLHRRKIRTILCPSVKIKQILRPVKDILGLNVPGVYKIPCTCVLYYTEGKAYPLGMLRTSRSVSIRKKELECHLRLGNSEKSALAYHGWTTGHTIQFENTEVLYKSTLWNVRITRESLELTLMQGGINKEDGTAWLPACKLLKGKEPK